MKSLVSNVFHKITVHNFYNNFKIKTTLENNSKAGILCLIILFLVIICLFNNFLVIIIIFLSHYNLLFFWFWRLMGLVISALLSSRIRGFSPKKKKEEKNLTVSLNHTSNFIGPQSVLSLEETLCVKLCRLIW